MLLIQPKIHFPGTAQLRKFAENEINRGLNSNVWIFLDALVGPLYISDGDALDQRASLSLLPQCRMRALTEACQFHLTDRSLHAQQQPIVGELGIVHGLAVNQQSANETAKLQ